MLPPEWIPPVDPARERIAHDVVRQARAELLIERPLEVVWVVGPIVSAGHSKPRKGGWDEAQPNVIFLSADLLTDPDDIIETVRHEVCHAAGWTTARLGLALAEYACGAFSAGVKPRIINGEPMLPSAPRLGPNDWPHELLPDAIRNAAPGEGLILTLEDD